MREDGLAISYACAKTLPQDGSRRGARAVINFVLHEASDHFTFFRPVARNCSAGR